MTGSAFKIVPMNRSHIRACRSIVSASEPWKRLQESVNFRAFPKDNRTGTMAYVCVCRSETVGFVLFIPEPVFARGGYLRALGVAPGFRGKGIGKKLLLFAEQKTARRSLHLFLCVSSFNRAGQRFYKKLGYCKAGSLPDIIRPGIAEFIYWKRLKRQ